MANRRRRPEKERLLSHVEVGPHCWEWKSALMPSGYGLFRGSDGGRLAHRASFRLFNGPLIEGMDVMHSCDNPRCVNPSHLTLGSRAENMRDAKRKGRSAHGQSHGMSKISEADVAAVIASPLFQREIASLFGISQGHVSSIKRGQKWAHMDKEKDHR